MTFNNQQMERLSEYEKHFQTIIRSRYARYPGVRALQEIHAIYSQINPNAPRLNSSCSSCVYRLLKECGDIYFATKSAIEAEATKKPKRKKK